MLAKINKPSYNSRGVAYAIVYVVLTHIQGGEGGRPSRLPPQSGEALSFPMLKSI
jgi:hypothetical protein